MKRYFTTGHSFLGCFLHHRFQRAVTSSLSCHLSLLPFSPTPKSAIIFNQFSIACRRTGYIVLTSIFNRPIGTHWVAWSLPHLASLLPKTFPWYPIQTGWPSEFFFFQFHLTQNRTHAMSTRQAGEHPSHKITAVPESQVLTTQSCLPRV